MKITEEEKDKIKLETSQKEINTSKPSLLLSSS